MPVYDIRSISQVGTTEPFELQVGRGQIPGHSVTHVFGHNPDVDNNVEATIWPIPGAILGHPSSPTIMKISSSSADDTAAGTGARTVRILGINGTGEYTEEVVTLNGQTEVNTVKTYDAIETMTVLTVGSGGVNAGTIYAGTGTVTSGVPAVPYSAIGVGDNTSLVGHWTCPTGFTGYLVKGKITTGTTTASQYIIGKLKLRDVDGVVRTAAIVTLADGAAWYDFDYPIRITAGQCVTATATGKGNNNDVSCYLQIVLTQERGPL
jgi:hypothetical protein